MTEQECRDLVRDRINIIRDEFKNTKYTPRSEAIIETRILNELLSIQREFGDLIPTGITPSIYYLSNLPASLPEDAELWASDWSVKADFVYDTKSMYLGIEPIAGEWRLGGCIVVGYLGK